MNPYFINEPAAISFSGGRTSAYMLYRILEAHDGELPGFIRAVFANTGKEMPETLDFVRDCGEQWGVDIAWVEYAGKRQWIEVDHSSASRNGEPFAQLIEDKKYLPNMMARFCTSELKVVPMQSYMISQGFPDYTTVVGIRADEPRRVAKQRTKPDYLVPLADDGVTVGDVMDFWEKQNFNFALTPRHSNCDLCFLKGGKIKMSLIEEDPSRADWWIKQETKINASFRSDQPSYTHMKTIATDQGQLFGFDDETIPCFCGD